MGASRFYFTEDDVKRLEEQAVQTRQDIISMITKAGAGHPGGSLSASDMITALYFHVMNIDPKNPSCPALYSCLARLGFFDPEELNHLREYGAMLQGHPDMHTTPGIDISTGSLGNGLAVAVGTQLSARVHGKDYMTYCMLGDGELQEGLVWEAAMAAGHHDLNNLVAIVDCNGVQINGSWTATASRSTDGSTTS